MVQTLSKAGTELIFVAEFSIKETSLVGVVAFSTDEAVAVNFL